jgi:hypothetical protein
VNAPLRIVLFSLGVYLLWRFLVLYQGVIRTHKNAERVWQETAALMVPRGERALELAQLLQRGGAQAGRVEQLRAAYQHALAAQTRPERIEAEQELSRRTLALTDAAARDPQLSTRADLSDLLAEMHERERLIAIARERYNEAASALNAVRRSFPAGLLVRALLPEAAPLFVGEHVSGD